MKEHFSEYECENCGNVWQENPKTVAGCPNCETPNCGVVIK
jgi:Zn finger protein HypA/HybF involved in hydrogenase expression